MTVDTPVQPPSAETAPLAASICNACRRGPVLHLDLFLMFDVPVPALQAAIDLAISSGQLFRSQTAAGFSYQSHLICADVKVGFSAGHS